MLKCYFLQSGCPSWCTQNSARTGFSVTWKVRNWFGHWKSEKCCWWSVKSDVYRPSCMTVINFCWKNESTHLLHVITKWRWKGVGVGEEEPTKHYIEVLLAPQMSRGIMPNTGKVGEFNFWNWVGGNPVKHSTNMLVSVACNLILVFKEL